MHPGGLSASAWMIAETSALLTISSPPTRGREGHRLVQFTADGHVLEPRVDGAGKMFYFSPAKVPGPGAHTHPTMGNAGQLRALRIPVWDICHEQHHAGGHSWWVALILWAWLGRVPCKCEGAQLQKVPSLCLEPTQRTRGELMAKPAQATVRTLGMALLGKQRWFLVRNIRSRLPWLHQGLEHRMGGSNPSRRAFLQSACAEHQCWQPHPWVLVRSEPQSSAATQRPGLNFNGKDRTLGTHTPTRSPSSSPP